MKINTILFMALLVLTFVSCKQKDEFQFEPEKGTLIDCQGNVYATVKIGNQWWMAENLKCTKYDTESERKPVVPATEILIPVSSRSTNVSYAPYYVNVSDSTTLYSENLTSNQRSKLGLLYTWAAAVGESSSSNGQSRTIDYTIARQGICPNGWHLPTDAEWTELIDTLGGSDVAGKKMKTADGWFEDANFVVGTNNSGFSVLPSGYDLGTVIGTAKTPATYGIGFDANFWSANANPWYRGFTCNSSVVKRLIYAKYNYLSIRCVKNEQ